MRLDFAEIPREAVLLFPGQRLTGEHDDMMIAKSLENPPLRLGRQRFGEIDAANRDTPRRRQAWPYDKPHTRTLAGRSSVTEAVQKSVQRPLYSQSP